MPDNGNRSTERLRPGAGNLCQVLLTPSRCRPVERLRGLPFADVCTALPQADIFRSRPSVRVSDCAGFGANNIGTPHGADNIRRGT